MLFNSAIFGLFILIVFPLYMAVRSDSGKKWLLLLASYAFYANWDVRYLPLLWISTLVDYTAGARMHAATSTKTRRFWLLASLVTNLGILGVFKYGNFLIGQTGSIWAALDITPPTLPGSIPVGISFYTFQTMSYTIDIYRRKTTPCGNPLDFAVYVSFFAQLVAGPIVRATEFLPQIQKMPRIVGAHVGEGIQRFILGLFKKVVIADNVGLFVDNVFATPGDFSAPTLWFAAYGFALQIYCDFSGYTDMALGIGRAFGLKIPENFNVPYVAVSITDFWRRWHMSLSRWLRDYLYIPLGGSRLSKILTYRNLMLTMLLGGLWHGAAWTFVIWGGFHGLLLAFERATGLGKAWEERTHGRFVFWARQIVTFHLVCFAWVIFRAESFGDLSTYVTRMFTEWGWYDYGERPGLLWAVALAGFVAAQYATVMLSLRTRVWDRLPAPVQGIVLGALVVAVGLTQVDEVAFIYFQF